MLNWGTSKMIGSKLHVFDSVLLAASTVQHILVDQFVIKHLMSHDKNFIYSC